MAKRAFAWILSVIMLFSVIPYVSFRAEAEKMEAAPVSAEGKLAEDMILETVWEVSEDTTLDLDGHRIVLKENGKILVKAGGRLNCKNGSITGAADGAVAVQGSLELTDVTVTGNTGTAIWGSGNARVRLTDVVITGNTGVTAVRMTDDAQLTVSGDTVITANTNAEKTADVVLSGPLQVDELTGGSNITVQLPETKTDASQVIRVSGSQTAIWQAGWVTYMKADGSTTDMGYISDGEGKKFAFGHYHGDQLYTAYNGGSNHAAMKTDAGYFYLTADILRSATSSAHLTLKKDAVQHLCLNGHSFTHRNPAIRLYYLDAGDDLTIEDCTSYYNEKNEFVAGGIYYGGSSESTVKDGSAFQVAAGGKLTLENVKVSGFHNTATNGTPIRVVGTADSSATVSMTGVELSGNTADTGGAMMAVTGAVVTMTDCRITGNTGRVVGGIYTAGDAAVTITDTVVTGNNSKNHGAVSMANPKVSLVLAGATVIADNEGGDLHLQKGEGYAVNVDALTAGAWVGIKLHKDRLAAEQMYFSTVLAEGANPLSYCFSNHDGYAVRKKDGRLILGAEHAHCLHGHENCEEHPVTEFGAWTDATALPTVGCYYLTTDVTLTNRAGLTDTELTLCLNGHTIRVADSYEKGRAFYLRGTAKLTLTDCAETPGKITGAKASAIMCDSGCTDAVIDIYRITVSGNQTAASGAAVVLQGTSTLNLHSGMLCDNAAGESGGAVYATQNATVNLLGGSITGNTAGNLGGGVYIGNNIKKTCLSGDITVTDNKAKDAANNLYLYGDGQFAAEALQEKASVGVSAAKAFRRISTVLTENFSGNFYSDSKSYTVSFRDNALYLDAVEGHSHCFCAAEDSNCAHSLVKFAPWEAVDSLPTEGNYYLTTDVVLTNRAGLTDVTLNLCLNGHTITVADTYAKGRAFYLYGSSKLTITDCNKTPGIITGASESAVVFDSGCEGAELNLYNVQLTGNRSSVAGGAVRVQGNAVFSLYSGKLTDNSVQSKLIVDSSGTPILAENGDQQVEYKLGGGAVAVVGKKGTFNMYGGSITDNRALTCEYKKANGSVAATGGHGGAIYASGNVNIHSGIISGNTAGGNAGGIIISGNDITLTVNGGEISRNKGQAAGGILMQNRSKLVLNGGSISANAATSGGGAYIAATASLEMNGGAITNNAATANGGGIYLYKATGLMNGGSITGNKTNSNGGGAYVSTTSTFTMKGGSVSGNQAKNAGGIQLLRSQGVFSGGTVSQNKARTNGGGIYLSGAQAKLYGTSVVNNTAEGNGGGICTGQATVTENGVKTKYQCQLTLSGSLISGNKAKSGGGVIVQSKTVFDYTGGVIRDNSVTSGGGGIFVSADATLNMSGGTITDNYAPNGGAVYHTDSFGNYTGGTIINCTAKDYSGGLYIRGAKTLVNVKNLKLTGHTSGNRGAAAMVQTNATAIFENCEFFENKTEGNGTVYVNINGHATFLNCKFYDNYVSGTAGALQGAQKCFVTASNCEFTNNTAGTDAGAILCRGNMDLVDCRITGNRAAANGGGVATASCGTKGCGPQEGLRLQNTVIADNIAGANGGGLYLGSGCKVALTEVQITDNNSALEGGALWTTDDLTMHSVTATGNTSGGKGFAVWLNDSQYDGHSYVAGLMKMSGDMIVTDNEGGDLYLGVKTTMTIGHEGLGQNTKVGITLDSGVLTNRLYGEYNYEGGNLVYTVTYGSRSFTEPEYDSAIVKTEQEETKPDAAADTDILLCTGIGVIGLAAIAGVVLVLAKKKKAGKAAENTNK